MPIKINVASLYWRPWGIPDPFPEYRFHDVRKWRFDYAWPNQMIAMEIEGGIWNHGAHVRGKHFLSDMAKYNTATRMGWQVYRFTPQQLKSGEAQQFIKDLFPHFSCLNT